MGRPDIAITIILANAGVVQARCGCKPGREADGWQEVRSLKCEQAELDAFAAAVSRALDTLTA